MASVELSARLQLGVSAAREAGELTLRHFYLRNYAVETKSDLTPVTVADRQAEELLRARIAAAFPGDAIMGEELPDRIGTTDFRWILDPIDGTKTFISGVPLYSMLIGVEFQSSCVMGVIHIPALSETVYAASGEGAWHVRGNRSPTAARASSTAALADSLFLTSEVGGFSKAGRKGAYDALESACRLSRTWGDGYGYLLVATGRAELMVDPRMNIWDCAALKPVLEEAGGTFTDWSGQATIHSGEAIATNGRILAEVLAMVRPFARS